MWIHSYLGHRAKLEEKSIIRSYIFFEKGEGNNFRVFFMIDILLQTEGKVIMVHFNV